MIPISKDERGLELVYGRVPGPIHYRGDPPFPSVMKYTISGIRRDFAEYERRIMTGEIPCPFKVTVTNHDGSILRTHPIPLTAAGKPVKQRATGGQKSIFGGQKSIFE